MKTLPVYRLGHYLDGRKPLVIHAARDIGEPSVTQLIRTLCGAHEGRQGYELQVCIVASPDVTCRRCKRSLA